MCDMHCNPKQNFLLKALPPKEFECILPHLELIEMLSGSILYESGEKLHSAYFPTNCIVSMLYVTESGASAEIAPVGNEGTIGIALFMGGQTMPHRAVVQSAGYAYR